MIIPYFLSATKALNRTNVIKLARACGTDTELAPHECYKMG